MESEVDLEFNAMSAVYGALKALDTAAQNRVLSYVVARLGLSLAESAPKRSQSDDSEGAGHGKSYQPLSNEQDNEAESQQGDDEFEGVSPVAKKWMARNGLKAADLGKIFSLGIEDIDLIAKTVPGSKKNQKMRSVFLLKGIASYLGTGAARFTYEQVKEACLHYDAFDSSNFAAYFKGLSGEVTGTKEAGYTLTPRGLSAGTDLVKEMRT